VKIILRGFQVLCVLIAIGTLYSWQAEKYVPDRMSLVETVGRISNVRYATGRYEYVDGILFWVENTEGRFVYSSYYPNFNWAKALFLRGASVQILHTKKDREIWTLKVNNRILADFESLKRERHKNANVALFMAFIFIAGIFLMQGFFRQDAQSKHKHALKFRNDVEFIECSNRKVVLHEPPLYCAAIIFLGVGLGIAIPFWNQTQIHFQWRLAVFAILIVVVLVIVAFLGAAFLCSVDSIITVERRVLRIHRRFLIFRWHWQYSTNEIDTITACRTHKGNGIRVKFASGKFKGLTFLGHWQSFDEETEAIRSALRYKYSDISD
jgi:hypothetical protein